MEDNGIVLLRKTESDVLCLDLNADLMVQNGSGIDNGLRIACQVINIMTLVLQQVVSSLLNKGQKSKAKIVAMIYNPLCYIFNEISSYLKDPANYKQGEIPHESKTMISIDDIDKETLKNDEDITVLKTVLRIVLAIAEVVEPVIELKTEGNSYIALYKISVNVVLDAMKDA